MLVLSRKAGEQVVIGGDITITMVQVRGGNVKIGVEAPPHVLVMRNELVLGPEGSTCDAVPETLSREPEVVSSERPADVEQVRKAQSAGRNASTPTTAKKNPFRNLRKIPR